MQITVLSVGRLKKGPEKQQIDTYLKRCPWPVSVIEVEERRPIRGPERMAREADLILKALPDGGHVIALDERGRTMTSEDFAHMIRDRRDQGLSHLTFLIGGADGYDPKVKARADMLLSLGAMTWPHMMARALLCEQLYRASCILSGHPYHKD
ncbi:23S rRNA (pseudouridine(1915)-N(3))-methyltransferase [hydrothermal vent metagenome]|uniref:23S rRNA (Pseudouridine(1915)-N(3))-methyltransferase n=1 Tax=hydrothermal vent metagenome TaxID=652676 RepID=A0A3B0SIC3_9ZZZZ